MVAHPGAKENSSKHINYTFKDLRILKDVANYQQGTKQGSGTPAPAIPTHSREDFI